MAILDGILGRTGTTDEDWEILEHEVAQMLSDTKAGGATADGRLRVYRAMLVEPSKYPEVLAAHGGQLSNLEVMVSYSVSGAVLVEPVIGKHGGPSRAAFGLADGCPRVFVHKRRHRKTLEPGLPRVRGERPDGLQKALARAIKQVSALLCFHTSILLLLSIELLV